MASELHMNSVVMGHHIYKSIWTPALAQEFLVEPENNNEHDIYTVCMKKDDTIIGHMPLAFSSIAGFFLNHQGRIWCIITGRRKRGLGIEVHCTYTFIGNQRTIKKFKTKLNNITSII